MKLSKFPSGNYVVTEEELCELLEKAFEAGCGSALANQDPGFEGVVPILYAEDQNNYVAKVLKGL